MLAWLVVLGKLGTRLEASYDLNMLAWLEVLGKLGPYLAVSYNLNMLAWLVVLGKPSKHLAVSLVVDYPSIPEMRGVEGYQDRHLVGEHT